jgi:hypothetical protein
MRLACGEHLLGQQPPAALTRASALLLAVLVEGLLHQRPSVVHSLHGPCSTPRT